MGGFRRKLFGFNREDVLAYIEQAHKEAAGRETELTAAAQEKEKETAALRAELGESKKLLEAAENQAAELRQRLAETEAALEEQKNLLKGKEEKTDSLEQQLTASRSAVQNLSNQVDAFQDQRDEIERLSQGIGRLYLTAQTNVESMLADAEQLTEQAAKETASRLAALSDCEEQLLTLREQIAEAFRRYDAELDGMCASLRKARETAERTEEGIRSKGAAVRLVLRDTGRSSLAAKAVHIKEG